MAKALEEQGYSTWYNDRDMLVGISYLVQRCEAIDQSDAFLLLVSSHALASHELTRQIEQAHRQNRRLLPILVNVAPAEVHKRQPSWQAALGAAASIELHGEDSRGVVARLVKSLERWGIQKRIEPATKKRPRTAPKSVASKWASDANQIEIENLGSVVFRNPIIDEFLEGRNKYFLSANKGLGKTLLLTCKRSLLTQGGKKSQFFVPEGKPYLDFMSDIPHQSDNHEVFLTELVNAKRLWGLALRISALSCHGAQFAGEDAFALKKWPKRLSDWLRGEKVEPTIVFKEVLGYSPREINRLINENMNDLEHKLRRIHSPTFLFIDKVDQGIQSLKRAAWVNVQAGLIEAAWDAMNANNHVRIYASIRQEAYSNYRSNIKANLHSATTVIQYTDAELNQLLDQLTNYYEGSKSFKEFVGLKAVRHPHAALPEDSFQYLNRHTLGRPRDLVILASEFSRPRLALTEPLYRRLVSETSATALAANIFEEMYVFLDCLADENERGRFLALLPCNILTRQEAVQIAFAFNHLPTDCVADFGLYSKEMHHPFWELYSAGLLGVVVKNPDDRKWVQRFKQPHQMIGNSPSAMPNVDFYVLHPALDGLISKNQCTSSYNVFQHILVGHNCPWEKYYSALYHLERSLFDEPDQDLLELIHAVLGEITPLLKRANPA